MSKLNDVLEEAKAKVLALETPSLVGKVTIAYKPEDLFDHMKTVRSLPAVGVMYEGMRSIPEGQTTDKKGISSEIVISLMLIEQDDSIHKSDEKRERAIDYLDAIRVQFLDQRSPVTGHIWHFLVEAPAELKAGLTCWVQRWALPVQLKPRQVRNQI